MDPYLLFLVSIASAGVLFLVFQTIEDHKRRKRRHRRK